MSLLKNIRQGLAKSREGLWSRTVGLIAGRRGLSPEELEQIEELLLMSDVGGAAADRLLAALRQGPTDRPALERLRSEMLGILSLNSGPSIQKAELTFRPQVWLVIGVNGSGKTTTCAKLARRLISQGRRVTLAAADTYRAAAIEQLKEWSRRLDSGFVGSQTGADSASVAFDAVASATSQGIDNLLIDTAGRLHTQKHLRDELGKIFSTVGKQLPGAPHLTLLVLDATTGQNAVSQARLFSEVVRIDGIVLTKLDGTAKGGIVLAIAQELKIPVLYAGVGEGMEDLLPFDAGSFVDGLLEGRG